ncbi:MAG: gfo/Idh/MocA family oxidoreductase, partial [Caldilineaceae bacterium SB0670_bin_27]|nr:gfo/Idh/MocA family oxidoreductase [Caldilineaceae bacterium SB0670_bin_27]
MARFGIVGAGWRVNWFLRAARALPEKLQVAGLAARRPQRAFDLADAYGVNLYRSPSEMIAAETPDFVVTSVSLPANPTIICQLVEQDMP